MKPMFVLVLVLAICIVGLFATGFPGQVAARVLYFQSALMTIAGNQAATVKALDQAIALDPKFADAYATRAIQYEIEGKLQQAVDDATRAIELDPELSKGYEYRASAFKRLHQYQRAVADYTRVVSFEPHNYQALIERAQCYNEMKQFQKALDDLNQAYKVDATTARWAFFYAVRARTYAGLGQFDKAIEDVHTAQPLDRGMRLEGLLSEISQQRAASVGPTGTGN